MCMTITEIIALIIGLAMFIGRGHALLYPKTQKEVWKKISSRPYCSIRLMGTVFLIAGVFLIILASETVEISKIVTIAAAGWLLFLGSSAFAVVPLKAALKTFPRINKRWMQVSNILVVIVGLLIICLVLK